MRRASDVQQDAVNVSDEPYDASAASKLNATDAATMAALPATSVVASLERVPSTQSTDSFHTASIDGDNEQQSAVQSEPALNSDVNKSARRLRRRSRIVLKLKESVPAALLDQPKSATPEPPSQRANPLRHRSDSFRQEKPKKRASVDVDPAQTPAIAVSPPTTRRSTQSPRTKPSTALHVSDQRAPGKYFNNVAHRSLRSVVASLRALRCTVRPIDQLCDRLQWSTYSTRRHRRRQHRRLHTHSRHDSRAQRAESVAATGARRCLKTHLNVLVR
jgi:hypothetical protein